MNEIHPTITTAQRKRIAAVLAPEGMYNSQPKRKQSDYDKRFQKKWRRTFEQSGSIFDAPRSGRPPVVSDEAVKRMEQIIKDCHVPGCDWLAHKLHQEGLTDHVVDHKTIQKALEDRSDHVSREVVSRVTALDDAHKTARVRWARKHMNDDFKKWLFIDGKNFVLKQTRTYPRQGVWCFDHIAPIQFTGETHTKIVVYAGVSWEGKTHLILCTGTSDHQHNDGFRYGHFSGGREQPATGMTTEEYIDLVKEFFQPFMATHWRRGAKLLADHATPHFAIDTMSEYEELGVDVIDDLPALSPDLNIIENVWGWMEQQLRWQDFSDLDEFKDRVAVLWQEIPLQMIRNMVGSMKGRLRKVIQNDGERIVTKGCTAFA